jgi:8-oxo-dGTP diphosphatase
MISDFHHSASTAAAIVDDAGRVLMVQRRDSGEWEPPGGVLEVDETIEDGLLREVLEETGLVVEPERLTGVYKNMATLVINFTFRCRVVSGELRESDETSDFAWVSPDHVSTMTNEVFVARLLDAFGDTVAVRMHNGHDLLPNR